ncbi:protein of unknown function [Cupriavidus taiwanensis]|nr:protein of unknown function [Cupriavidus taiwanensis]
MPDLGLLPFAYLGLSPGPGPDCRRQPAARI